MTETVVHQLNGLHVGGVETLCLQLLAHAPRGVRNVVVNIDPSERALSQQFLSTGAELVDVPYSAADRSGYFRRLCEALRVIRPNAVLSYAFGHHVLAVAAARTVGCERAAVHAGNPAQGDRRAMWRALSVASLFLRCPILSCSEAVQSSLRALDVPLPQGSRVIWNGVELSRFRPLRRREPRDTIVLGMVARLNGIKDHLTLIRAIAALKSENVKLRLFGDGELRMSLEAEVDRLRLRERVTFEGAVHDIPTAMDDLDIVTFSTTDREGFGIALIEAMAARKPIIATDVAATREVLGREALLIPPGDASAFARGIESLIANPAQREQLAGGAFRRALSHFDARRCAREYYEALLGGSRP